MRDLQAPRPRVSRETRLLFVTIACAIAALWVLGRLRFPERASTSPVPAVLAPLALPSSFDELAGAVTQFASGLAASTVGVAIVDPGGDPGNARVVQALRWRDDLAVVAGAGRAVVPEEADFVLRASALVLGETAVVAAGSMFFSGQ